MEKMVSILKAAASKDPFRPGLNYIVFDGNNAIACNAKVYIQTPFEVNMPVAVHPKTKGVYQLNGKVIENDNQNILPDFASIKPIGDVSEYSTINNPILRFDPKRSVKIGERSYLGEYLNTVFSIAEKLKIKGLSLRPFTVRNLTGLLVTSENGFYAIVMVDTLSSKPYIEILKD